MNYQVQKDNKQYFHVLDGLRGVAAIAVLIFHYVELIHAGKGNINPMPHGYLAVDFFFCLSGFVIAHAYDHRLPELGAKKFLLNRLIRLHPLVVFGTLLGVIAYIVDPLTSVDWYKLSIAAIPAALLVPSIPLPHRFGAIFPLNAPAWSLFYEYVISILYVFVIARLKNHVLIIIACAGAIIVTYVAYKTGNLSYGWNFKTFFSGFWRVIFSFTAGLLIYRLNAKINNQYALWLPSIILVATFFIPNSKGDWYIESFLVVVILPFVVCLGAGADVKNNMIKWCKLLGDLSYPIYMTHYASVFLFWAYLKQNTQLTIGDKYLLAFVCVIANLIFAYITLKVFDKPIRNWLTKKINKTKGECID